MGVSKQKQEALALRMSHLGIYEKDLVEKYIGGRGPGGQKVQTTASTVYLKHLPTGIEVKCSIERSQHTNRYLARSILCDHIEQRLLGELSSKEQEHKKIRKQKNTRARKTKRKLQDNSVNKL
jgi:protein subunit release factor B